MGTFGPAVIVGFFQMEKRSQPLSSPPASDRDQILEIVHSEFRPREPTEQTNQESKSSRSTHFE